MIQVEINNRQQTLTIDEQQLREAVVGVLQAAGRANALVSVAIVDDSTMHELNRQYLAHDYPTDVLSFVLEENEEMLDGEVIVSADTAAQIGPAYGASPQQELLHYLIHGCLHLVGHDDHEEEKLRTMREQEKFHLNQFGMEPNFVQRAAGIGQKGGQTL
ncbi:MAG: putative rRNA maturation factor [Pirellulaceae bacterium]|jgi:probable rRNA maturation factor